MKKQKSRTRAKSQKRLPEKTSGPSIDALIKQHSEEYSLEVLPDIVHHMNFYRCVDCGKVLEVPHGPYIMDVKALCRECVDKRGRSEEEEGDDSTSGSEKKLSEWMEAGYLRGQIATLLWLKDLIDTGRLRTIKELAEFLDDAQRGKIKHTDRVFDEIDELIVQNLQAGVRAYRKEAVEAVANKYGLNPESLNISYQQRHLDKKTIKNP